MIKLSVREIKKLPPRSYVTIGKNQGKGTDLPSFKDYILNVSNTSTCERGEKYDFHLNRYIHIQQKMLFVWNFIKKEGLVRLELEGEFP